MTPFSKLNSIFRKLPVHLAIILMCIMWLVPTLGLFITSFRGREDVRTSGWWTVFSTGRSTVVEGQQEYQDYCASCHGDNGLDVAGVDLFSQDILAKYPRGNRLYIYLKEPVNGQPHLVNPQLPDNAKDALLIVNPIHNYMGSSKEQKTFFSQFSLSNYVDALVGYKGTNSYLQDCQGGYESSMGKFTCNFLNDLSNPEGMGRAFINTLIVVIPATLLPILFAAFAAYAFAWLDFPGRQWLFALLVGLQIIPLQMTLVPISRIYASIGLQDTFLGIWLFHTGFGLPYAIYLMRNFIGSLPKELFESAYIDGTNHWTAFRKFALPLATPAIASLGIYQFIWVWNDFLVAKIFLATKPVLTVQITNLIDPRGQNWHLLTGAAFLSFILPMVVFFAFQRFFVRGMLAGSVKG
jgi:alpha-glucoside transport system permease protein